MIKLSTVQQLLRSNAPIIVGVFLCAYFSYHLVSGERNIARLHDMTYKSSLKELQLSALHKKKDALKNKVAMLRPESISADLLDEQIRIILGYQQKDEFAVLEYSSAKAMQ